jgi:protease PrsW
MLPASLGPALLCLLPALCFLTALYYLDSYKLVHPGLLMAVMAAGIVAAALGYLVNRGLLAHWPFERAAYPRYVSPVLEELLKGSIIAWLIWRHRIGFLIDAAILGFAVGCGFALTENQYVLWQIPNAVMSTWIVRGFGTAIMHGGATAVVAVVALAVIEGDERDERHAALAALPGVLAAMALHSAFNHLAGSPRAATLFVLIAVPALLLLAFHRAERTLGDWLEHGLDADAHMLELVHSGQLSQSPVGRYLTSLKKRFRGPVVADLLCYLGLFSELALRAKGLAIMRENGFEPAIDAETRAKFTELRYLEQSIGRTALLALHPLLPMRRKALSQIYRLGD